MEKCEVIHVNYEKSDTIEKQGKRKEIEKYLKQGYSEKVERNGYRVLVKPAKVNVDLKNTSGSYTFDMKDEIVDYYNKERISEKLVKNFEQDIGTGKISISVDNGNPVIN